MENFNSFALRHIGLSQADIESLLDQLGYKDLEEFSKSVLPENIFIDQKLELNDAMSEEDALKAIKEISKANSVYRSFIGQGYYGTITPKVILRNVFENPGWYTSYTPYQAEISQGRLEALINFQTMVGDLTGFEIANASLLDEATAAAESMTLAHRVGKSKSQKFFIDQNCFPQTISVVTARAKPIGIEVMVGDPQKLIDLTEDTYFGALLQYPGNDGAITDFSQEIKSIHDNNGLVIMATDLLALTMLKSPGELGADIAIGSSQRFGVPLGFGGPHAAFMATKEQYKRSLPGRLIGASIDADGRTAYRLALQTREQHIRREKATSNICTAQALLAIMAGFYAAYHGPEGLKQIAQSVHLKAIALAKEINELGYALRSSNFFDTVTVHTKSQTKEVFSAAQKQLMNIRMLDENHISISLDETTSDLEVQSIAKLFKGITKKEKAVSSFDLPNNILRSSEYLTHPVFHLYRTETEMLRYIRKLCDKDIALDRAMIPLGSCTMKLNATSEMIPVGWEEFSNIHPYAPQDQVAGYKILIKDLEAKLSEITGYAAVSLQPNAGSQGEYAGLLAIDAFHRSNGDQQRKICLIPESAHGTNPASAQMAGMKVVPISCDKKGNIDLEDLKEKATHHSNELAAIMITYPSTHGVFETTVSEVCKIIHDHGGKVYIDGANLNAMVGLCKPGEFGGDVSHLNLHKTFCIPHGGGGPGVGPIGVVEDLAPHLPSDPLTYKQTSKNVGPVAATNFGSASILPISWMYIQMMGASGLRKATQVAILSANYIAQKLSSHYKILYTGKNGLIAHECILDIRPLKELCGVEVDDIAKRLIDFGFHAPTMSFPVPGTLMIEPTESESLVELDRFIEAMISIRNEINQIEEGTYSVEDSPLRNAPHCAEKVTSDNWQYKYSRSIAAYPAELKGRNKYWPPIGRVDNVYGDKNLMCSCPSMSDYQEEN
ncbi:aminomethyl-transferring glycine dehydrogenase [Gammaproteobacteria bacterium]|nr:aminomethyl-transferring glycine dehydrogenase [Gammaproteobacteria bacterium]MDB2339112.1 aminomethyl-transferring glycine dehydrogenase [Gammaproteobacteria bacterium]